MRKTLLNLELLQLACQTRLRREAILCLKIRCTIVGTSRWGGASKLAVPIRQKKKGREPPASTNNCSPATSKSLLKIKLLEHKSTKEGFLTAPKSSRTLESTSICGFVM